MVTALVLGSVALAELPVVALPRRHWEMEMTESLSAAVAVGQGIAITLAIVSTAEVEEEVPPQEQAGLADLLFLEVEAEVAVEGQTLAMLRLQDRQAEHTMRSRGRVAAVALVPLKVAQVELVHHEAAPVSAETEVEEALEITLQPAEPVALVALQVVEAEVAVEEQQQVEAVEMEQEEK